MEVVVQMFQRLGLRFVLLTRYGTLRGILTKMVSLCTYCLRSVVTDSAG